MLTLNALVELLTEKGVLSKPEILKRVKKLQIPRLIASVLALLMAACASSPAKTIRFSGYDWKVKSGSHEGPGPNNWDEKSDHPELVAAKARIVQLPDPRCRTGWHQRDRHRVR